MHLDYELNNNFIKLRHRHISLPLALVYGTSQGELMKAVMLGIVCPKLYCKRTRPFIFRADDIYPVKAGNGTDRHCDIICVLSVTVYGTSPRGAGNDDFDNPDVLVEGKFQMPRIRT